MTTLAHPHSAAIDESSTPSQPPCPAHASPTAREARDADIAFSTRPARELPGTERLAWLESGLRPGREGRLAREYPQVFGAGSEACSIVLREAGVPAAHAVLLPARARVGAHRLRIGMISLVYTAPAFRGRGHAGRVVAAAVDRARTSGLGIALLWSSRDSLYRRQGFHPAGTEWLLALDERVISTALARGLSERPAPEAAELGTPTETDWSEIEGLRAAREAGIEIPAPIFRELRRIPGLEVRVTRRKGRLTAFAMCGRGDDFEHVVHEWGGDALDALACCRALLEPAGRGGELLLLTPPGTGEVSWRLRQAGARVVRQPLAWMRLCDRRSLTADLLGDDRARRPDALPTDDRELLEALVGSPEPPDAGGRALREPIGGPDGPSLPLPFFVWGLESI